MKLFTRAIAGDKNTYLMGTCDQKGESFEKFMIEAANPKDALKAGELIVGCYKYFKDRGFSSEHVMLIGVGAPC